MFKILPSARHLLIQVAHICINSSDRSSVLWCPSKHDSATTFWDWSFMPIYTFDWLWHQHIVIDWCWLMLADAVTLAVTPDSYTRQSIPSFLETVIFGLGVIWNELLWTRKSDGNETCMVVKTEAGTFEEIEKNYNIQKARLLPETQHLKVRTFLFHRGGVWISSQHKPFET